MADYTYEIAWWPAPDAVKKDLNAYKPVVDVIKRHTSLPVLIGTSVENQDFVQIVTWENTAAHSAFVAHPDRPAVLKDHPTLFPSTGLGDAKVYHTHLSADPLPILQAPIVEHTFLTLKDGVSVEDLKPVLLSASKKLDEHKDISPGAVLGTVEGKPDQIFILAGWKSLEAHQEYNAKGSPADEDNNKIREKIKDYTLFHVAYTRQT